MPPDDFGPIYAETLPGIATGAFPVEPWNTWTNLVFVALFVHIVVRTRLNYRCYPLIVTSLPILAIGIIGGTIYHATRSHPVWLLMDVVPIVVLISAAALAFWHQVVDTWPRAVFFFLLVALSGRIAGLVLVSEHTIRITLGYLSAALSIIFPLVVIVARSGWKNLGLLAGVILSFTTALTFRILDRPGTPPLLPMGTHFLWHVFGGCAVWMLMMLIIRLNESTARPCAATKTSPER
jgi:hemolysin III